MLYPCPGCGALFPSYNGPTHRYIGASAGCWALFTWDLKLGWVVDNDETHATGLVGKSEVPSNTRRLTIHVGKDDLLDPLLGDAYGVQHHGDDSPQAVQSVALHLLNLYGVISGRTTRPRWPMDRALRVRGVFRKLTPPSLGAALTIRHLFPGGGVVAPVTRSQYVSSVYEEWMALHRSIVEEWYECYVIADDVVPN